MLKPDNFADKLVLTTDMNSVCTDNTVKLEIEAPGVRNPAGISCTISCLASILDLASKA